MKRVAKTIGDLNAEAKTPEAQAMTEAEKQGEVNSAAQFIADETKDAVQNEDKQQDNALKALEEVNGIMDDFMIKGEEAPGGIRRVDEGHKDLQHPRGDFGDARRGHGPG